VSRGVAKRKANRRSLRKLNAAIGVTDVGVLFDLYLKQVSPKHVTLNQIFAGIMSSMLIVIVCMVLMYIWPGVTLWLPNYGD
jgi:TRAP-type mannitol/chloroaromatic compound transport system permease large subunit